MRILLTNDDGIGAPGLDALRSRLAKMGEVVTVAPASQQSATGNAISLHRPIRVHQHDGLTYSVDGTPADAVKLALRALFRRPPDLVVSGMNFGLNCGCNILYSGTLAGALEGAQHGLPAYAVSLEVSPKPRWKEAASRAGRLIEKLHGARRDAGVVININIPAGKVRGVRVARQEMQPYLDSFERSEEARGHVTYSYHGMKEWNLPASDGAMPSDQQAVIEKFISVTPLHRDLTRHDLMDGLARAVRNGSRR